MKPNPTTWVDVSGVDIVFGLFALLSLITGIQLLREYHRLALADGMISGKDLLGTFAPWPLACLLGWVAYTNVNEHHLLRGECRYTAARVYQNRRYKGDQESRFEYWVRGKRYHFDANMGWRGGWHTLDTWWYVRYAVPDPSVHEFVNQAVADTVRYAPARGWASMLAPVMPARPPVSPPARLPVPAKAVESSGLAAPRDSQLPPRALFPPPASPLHYALPGEPGYKPGQQTR